jgi:hypothetical protein
MGETTIRLSMIASGAVIALSDVALAGGAVPGPAAGIGLPVLAVVGVGYWVYRRFRRPD